MKVCTDACVLGAYADVGLGGRILDIGTGTGLLALMTAQRNVTAYIDAVEIDTSAVGQALDNVANSPFAERVNVAQTRIQDFSTTYHYDRILTNPPFYTNHLRSPDAAVNRALHTDELPFGELIEAVSRLLKPDGQWWVLLPPYEAGKLVELAKDRGLYPFHQLSLRHRAQKPIFRVVIGFSFQESVTLAETTLDIYTFQEPDRSKEVYTLEFQTLLRDFYLIF
ncbi:methyltransferase [Spirosoma sp. BT702]|uniref:tRNA1(Val) (adenine(37)-N6)-methyltransferase n=1 Tax=Spirosoma profusum TaxID=2771354 RepID=A0A927ASQ6_9BACT|nr:methyltransferase [Spirosoma profusum]MBD2704276.1 methyltransferase [Spirosoma profusum]